MRPAAAGVATGGGGYQWARVVPRAWTIAFAEMAAAELPTRSLEDWIEQAEFELRGEVPTSVLGARLRTGCGDDGHEVAAAVRTLVGLEGAA
jgi:hypothetical protein